MRPNSNQPSFGGQSGGDEIDRAREAKELMTIIEGESTDQLNNVELQFIERMHDAFQQYGERARVSVKQLFWLRDIKDKLI